mmetsp:Transcript_33101/g.83193  ORF Transcript_33101/g.83193 Transcript_33101/m.83193 type:complete len:448 (+) Transcript_33101:265-1608(+)|eukprot:CAMPEP_0177658032 /NCGR_PEP_ID=MMETSP0447-20121125/16570_1 /TAXON_ID=0 /ORGANISM="Stygamoeba regulata, Strain BSH-02190019" /LENGTH=447 /DNA_ID=CAMNT_0019162563 /DNA_START=226 /DNA_END=1569 /DNA_ORIENTATION=-
MLMNHSKYMPRDTAVDHTLESNVFTTSASGQADVDLVSSCFLTPSREELAWLTANQSLTVPANRFGGDHDLVQELSFNELDSYCDAGMTSCSGAPPCLSSFAGFSTSSAAAVATAAAAPLSLSGKLQDCTDLFSELLCTQTVTGPSHPQHSSKRSRQNDMADRPEYDEVQPQLAEDDLVAELATLLPSFGAQQPVQILAHRSAAPLPLKTATMSTTTTTAAVLGEKRARSPLSVMTTGEESYSTTRHCYSPILMDSSDRCGPGDCASAAVCGSGLSAFAAVQQAARRSPGIALGEVLAVTTQHTLLRLDNGDGIALSDGVHLLVCDDTCMADRLRAIHLSASGVLLRGVVPIVAVQQLSPLTHSSRVQSVPDRILSGKCALHTRTLGYRGRGTAMVVRKLYGSLLENRSVARVLKKDAGLLLRARFQCNCPLAPVDACQKGRGRRSR